MSTTNSFILAELVLSPQGHVYLDYNETSNEQLSFSEFEKIKSLFTQGSTAGLLYLGIQDFISLPPSFLFWQTFARRFITSVCKLTPLENIKTIPNIPSPKKEDLQEIIDTAFLMKGVEYLTSEVLVSLWNNLSNFLQNELQNFSGSAQDYFNSFNPRWNLVGRVCFHLAENKNNQDFPFAFLATYASELSKGSKISHLPLKRALEEYVGDKNHGALLALLLPVQKAAEQSRFVKSLVDSKDVFQPLMWTVDEAYKFLKDISLMESSGIIVRVPNWWNKQKSSRPKVSVKIGDNAKSLLGMDTILDFDIHLTLSNGVELSKEEWESLSNLKDGLIKIKGEWVEVNKEKLNAVLAYWEKFKRNASDGLSMSESLRLLAGEGSSILTSNNPEESEIIKEWSSVTAGNFLKDVLEKLRNPENSQKEKVEEILKTFLLGTLRPYQLEGVHWLLLLYQLRLGGCLADDMGLGKTIQILSLLLIIKNFTLKDKSKKPHLLIVPASLLGNWQAEISHFSPSIKLMIAHSSICEKEKLLDIKEKHFDSYDLIITTYGFIYRLPWMQKINWDLVILDEAQLIKNNETKQTRFVKTLKSKVRFALTGTPIENRLSDLWSLFDFILPGLLGSSKVFGDYSKKVGKDSNTFYNLFISSLRRLTQPYILRRLKSDKKIISDLPDKTEIKTFCLLSKEQIRVYQQTVIELKDALKIATGIQRRGLVLSTLMRLKQICNHPVQLLGYGEYIKKESGKFIRLEEICEEIAAKQEKVLVFTQFKEIIPAISSLLAKVFNREGVILHGETSVKKRSELVSLFQEDHGPPFFVLSLKAGGVGLNLTKASHVIHFDRWWNPAVENQATDRAYRIGQKHPVMVHKFICQGTIEEKIDDLISSKKKLSEEILENSSEILLTELTNKELLDIISLDINRSLGEL